MNFKMSIILNGIVIVGGASVATGALYLIFRKVRAHSAKHKPEVMNKINDFLGTQDTKHLN